MQGKTIQEKTRHVKSSQGKASQVKASQVKSSQGKARQGREKTGKGEARQNTPRRGKKRQDPTKRSTHSISWHIVRALLSDRRRFLFSRRLKLVTLCPYCFCKFAEEVLDPTLPGSMFISRVGFYREI